MICPFFGKNEDYCDVGCGYISPSDVKKIIQFCSAHPDRCSIYQDLMERHPEEAAYPAPEEATPAPPIAARLSQPTPPEPTPVIAGNRANHESGPLKKTEGKQLAEIDTLAHPAPSGLLAFGMTTALLSLHHTGLFLLDSTMLGMGIFYGGLVQIIIGFMEWKRQHIFGAAAFTAFGLFWLSLIAMTIIPDTRFDQLPQDSAMAAYLILWGLFTTVLFIGALRLNKSLQLVLGSLTLFFFLLSAGTLTSSRFLLAIAGWEGVLCASTAIYTGIAQILNEIFGRSVIPLGEHKRPTARTIQNHQF